MSMLYATLFRLAVRMKHLFLAVKQVLDLHQAHEATIIVLDVRRPLLFLSKILSELVECYEFFIVCAQVVFRQSLLFYVRN